MSKMYSCITRHRLVLFHCFILFSFTLILQQYSMGEDWSFYLVPTELGETERETEIPFFISFFFLLALNESTVC